MKILKFFQWFFNFGKKYKKREEKYHRDSRKFGTSGELITVILYTAFPILMTIGAFKLPWGEISGVFKIICIIAFIPATFWTASELMITGIVALRHRMRMKIQNKVEGEAIGGLAEAISGKEMTAEDEQKIKDYKAKGTAHKYDLVVGISGIVCSVAVIITCATLFFVFITQLIKGLK